MESINDFIHNHISVVNKNTLLSIDFGRNINPTIFDKRFPVQKLETVFKKLNQHQYGHKKPKITRLLIYKAKNTLIAVSSAYPQNQSMYSYETSELMQTEYANLSLTKISLTKNYVSRFYYNTIESLERLELHLPMFQLQIDHHSSAKFFTIKAIVSRPADPNLLAEHIHTLISIINSV